MAKGNKGKAKSKDIEIIEDDLSVGEEKEENFGTDPEDEEIDPDKDY